MFLHTRKATVSRGLTCALNWWGYQDLNLGPLPYQGVDLVALEASKHV